MPRSIWNGIISFGMVSIPVKLYSATEKKDISFHLLHEKDNTRIRDMKWCPLEDKPIEWEEITRGYEYAKGKYVKMTPEDFEKLPLPSKHMIEISAFVKSEEIDPVYYEKSYYLEAEEAATKPFVLFMRALTDKQMIAIGTVAIRNKERLCALRPLGGTLMMDTLLYPDEIRVTGEEDLPRTRISEAEMDMAYRLVDLMAKPFQPEDYKDHYREALMKVIEAKLEGEELVEEPIAAPSGRVIDLMEALRASVESATKTGGKSARAEADGDAEEEDHPKRSRKRTSHKAEEEEAEEKPHKRKRKKVS
jgi:DNA end-binding protein Ku